MSKYSLQFLVALCILGVLGIIGFLLVQWLHEIGMVLDGIVAIGLVAHYKSVEKDL